MKCNCFSQLVTDLYNHFLSRSRVIFATMKFETLTGCLCKIERFQAVSCDITRITTLGTTYVVFVGFGGPFLVIAIVSSKIGYLTCP